MKRFLLRRKKIFFGVLILLGIGILLFTRSRQNAAKVAEYATAERTTIEETIEVPGQVDAGVKASLKFLGGGKLVSLPLEEGEMVKKGARIASIDTRDLQKSVESSLLDYMSTRADFDQGFDDRKDTALSDTIRRSANKLQYTLDKSVIAVEAKDIALKNATLISPIDGIITSLPVDTVGVPVIATDVFEIINPDTLLFEAEVDEIDVGRVEKGTPVRIVLDAYPDQTIQGTIHSVGLKAQASSQSSGGTVFPVKVVLPGANILKTRLGMNGTMTIITKKSEGVLSIPIDATSVREGKTYVSVRNPKDEKKPVEREIQTGIENEDRIEVVSGIESGEQVVIPE
jgi:HlyD family secretion protein